MSGYVTGPVVNPVDSHEHYMQGDSDFAKFDPNAPRSSNVWAMYDGQFRTFSTRGAAINAFHRSSAAQLFELLPDVGWKLVVLKSHKAKSFCDRCDRPIDPQLQSSPSHTWGPPAFRWELKRTPGNRLIYPLVCECLCGQPGCK